MSTLPDPSLLSAVPDREFQVQEGHHIVVLSMRDGKPMGIIEAPMEAIGCCKKMFREPPGKYVYEIVRSTTEPLIISNICLQICVAFIPHIFHMRFMPSKTYYQELCVQNIDPARPTI